jgi:hypothetical protein
MVDRAEKTWAQYQQFLQDPGPAVIGAMPGASCFGPAYEFAFIFNTDLKRRKLRHKVPITYVTSEPYIGHMGLGGVGDSKSMLESEFRNNDIKWITNAKVTKVEAGKMFVTEMDEGGQPKIYSAPNEARRSKPEPPANHRRQRLDRAEDGPRPKRLADRRSVERCALANGSGKGVRGHGKSQRHCWCPAPSLPPQSSKPSPLSAENRSSTPAASCRPPRAHRGPRLHGPRRDPQPCHRESRLPPSS